MGLTRAFTFNSIREKYTVSVFSCFMLDIKYIIKTLNLITPSAQGKKKKTRQSQQPFCSAIDTEPMVSGGVSRKCIHFMACLLSNNIFGSFLI